MELEALNHFGEAEAECSEENREFHMALVKKKLIKDGFHKHKILSSDLVQVLKVKNLFWATTFLCKP